MKKKVNYIKGFTLVEVLLVMGIFIILTVIGFNGFLSIRESFIARENVELIIQDIESTKLKAMNMEGGKEATWVYGFGIDFTDANAKIKTGDYKFFKWCSPVKEYGGTFSLNTQTVSPTKNILPNIIEGIDLDETISPYPLCGTGSESVYNNGRLIKCYFTTNDCQENASGLIKMNEVSTLLDREENQMELLTNINGANPLSPPNFLFFESLTGRAIIYNLEGKPESYDDSTGEVVFNIDIIAPIDIVLHRKRSNKFDLITVYPISGEVIHHVYNVNDYLNVNQAYCEPDANNKLNYFKMDGHCYERYGIDDEINSFRD